MIGFFLKNQASFFICRHYGGKVKNHILFMEGFL